MAKLINKALIDSSIDYSELCNEIEKYYLLLRDGKVKVTSRIFEQTKDGGMYLLGGATNFENENYISMSQPVMPWLRDKAIPVATTSYLYSSFRTGETLAVIGGSDIVAYRTPAKSVVTAKHLAAQKDEYTLGLIGLGIQAVTHAEAFNSQFNVSRIIGSSRTPKKWKNNLDSIEKKVGKKVELLSIEEVVAQSDILVVITSHKEPLVSFSQLHKGQLVIGTDHAETVNRDVVLNADKVFVDYRPTAENENASVKILLDEGQKYDDIVDGDLAELVSKEKQGRENNDEVIFFQSLGVMCENLAAVEYLYEKVKDTATDIEL